jgi:ABC-2 type transport system permease protein
VIDSLTRMTALVRKEFLHLIRDPRALALVLALPAMQLLLFAWAISFDVRDVPTVVWDADRTPASRAYAQEYSSGGFFRVQGSVDSEASLDRAFERGWAQVAIVIPAGFQRTLDAGDRASVQVLVDGSSPTSARMGEAFAIALNQRYNASSFATWAQRSPDAVNLDGVAGGVLEPRVRTWYNPDRLSSVFLIPGLIVVIIMIVTVQQTAVTIVRERDLHTAEQMLVSPLRHTELVVGKLLPWTVLAFLEMGVIIGLGMWLFELPLRGSSVVLGLAAVMFVFASLAIGLIISSLTPSAETANIAALLIAVLPSFLLSGFAFPIASMPAALQAVTYLFPARQMVVISRGVFLKGAGFSEVAFELAQLALYVVVAVTVAVQLYARRARR